MDRIQKVTFKGIFIWAVVLIFYFYECFLRVYPNTLSDNLIKDFNINAEHFSIIGSAFFISYAFMQTPAGLLIQKFGARYLLTFSALLCTFGVFLFSFADIFFMVIMSRFFMGLGASFAYVGILSISLNWFPTKHFGFITGLTQLLGSIGPILAGAPLVYLIKAFNGDWKQIFFYIGIIGIILVFSIFIFVRNKPKLANKIVFLQSSQANLKKSYLFLKNMQILWLVLYTGLIYSAMPVFGSFFGTIYLQTRNFEKSKAALICSMLWIGYSIGSPIIGKLSDKTHRRVPWMILCAISGLLGSALLIFFPSNNEYLLIFFFLLIGFGGAGQVISFATSSENVPNELRTSIIGLANTFLMLFGAILPIFIGTIIHPDGATLAKYSIFDFTKGFFITPIIFFICLLIAIFGIKETYCRSKYEIHHL